MQNNTDKAEQKTAGASQNRAIKCVHCGVMIGVGETHRHKTAGGKPELPTDDMRKAINQARLEADWAIARKAQARHDAGGSYHDDGSGIPKSDAEIDTKFIKQDALLAQAQHSPLPWSYSSIGGDNLIMSRKGHERVAVAEVLYDEAVDRVKHLFKETSKLGLDYPTDKMLEDMVRDAEWNALWNPREIAEQHDQDMREMRRIWNRALGANVVEESELIAERDWSQHLRIQLAAEVEKVNKLQQQLAAERDKASVERMYEERSDQIAPKFTTQQWNILRDTVKELREQLAAERKKREKSDARFN